MAVTYTDVFKIVGDAAPYNTFAAAVTALIADGTNWILVVPRGTHVAGGVTVPATVKLVVHHGVTFTVANGTTFTINGLIEAPRSTIFALTGTGKVAFGTKQKTYYPEWWGAVGDGATDDSTKIQACLNQVPAGGTILLDSKDYRCNATITWPTTNYVSIIGQGQQRSFITSNAGAANRGIDWVHVATDLKGITLKSLTFRGFEGSANAPIRAMNFTHNIYDMLLEDCEFYNWRATVVGVGGSVTSNIVIRNCYFHDNGDNAWGVTAYGLIEDGGSIINNLLVEGCRFINNNANQSAHTEHDFYLGQSTNVWIINNYFEGTFDQVQLYNGGAVYNYNVHFEGNTLKDVAVNYFDKCIGLSLCNNVFNNSAASISNSYDVNVSGNTFVGSSADASIGFTTLVGATDALISNNVFASLTKRNLWAYGGARQKYVNNYISGAAAADYLVSLGDSTSPANITLEGNTIVNVGNASGTGLVAVYGTTYLLGANFLFKNNILNTDRTDAFNTAQTPAATWVFSGNRTVAGAWTGAVNSSSYIYKQSAASSATPTPAVGVDGDEIHYNLTALAEAATFGAPTGTPIDGQKLRVRIKDNGTARALDFNAIYRFGDVAKPTTTIISKTQYIGFIFNSADTKWDCVGSTGGLT